VGEVRCWQSVRTTGVGERQRVACLEIDLAASSIGGGLDLTYLPFRASDTTDPILAFAETMSFFGAQAPDRRSVLVIARGTRNRHFAERYPGLKAPEYEGTTIVSADAAELSVVREAVQRGVLSVDGARLRTTDEADHTLATVVRRLTVDRRWFYSPAGKSDFRVKNALDGSIDLVAPLNPSTGFLAEAEGPDSAAAFNGGYFLWVEEETDDPFSFAQDAVGLMICGGEVLGPPILKRSALLTTQTVYPRDGDERSYSLGACRAVITSVSLENYAVMLPGGLVVGGRLCRRDHLMSTFDRFESFLDADLNPSRSGDSRAAFFNRLWDTSKEVTSTFTPRAAGRVELVISRHEVVAIKEGGETFIPRNGLVVSVPSSMCDVQALLSLVGKPGGSRIKQTVDIGDHALKPISGMQTGPQIVRDGAKVDVLADLAAGREQFVSIDRAKGEGGYPPVYVFNDRHVTSGVARIAFGTKADGRCVVVVFEGSEPRTFDSESDSRGASTEEVTEFLLSLGCREAVALDGGGSAEITFGGRSVVRVADRNDVPFVPSRRLIPGRWMVAR
jgi:Phosphodiester glycosidase